LPPLPLVETVDKEIVLTGTTIAAAAATTTTEDNISNTIAGEIQHLTDAEIEGMNIIQLRHEELKFGRLPSTKGNKVPLQD
tara:strand:- start:482 stop:724 length:243 start_codon:yes stop_codon:yes gene_type:complete